jgi:hypothetical protein
MRVRLGNFQFFKGNGNDIVCKGGKGIGTICEDAIKYGGKWHFVDIKTGHLRSSYAKPQNAFWVYDIDKQLKEEKAIQIIQ